MRAVLDKYRLKQKIDRKKLSPKNTTGFSLIELTIYIGLLTVFILILTEIFTSVLNAQLSTSSSSSVAQDGRFIYSRLIYDINRADSASMPANLGETNDTLILNIDGENYTYYQNNSNLYIEDATGQYQLNSSETSISGLSFTRIGNNGGKHTFQINFTVTGNIPLKGGRIDSQVFETTAGLR
jgi:Tfp pilus assembly protein FimT